LYGRRIDAILVWMVGSIANAKVAKVARTDTVWFGAKKKAASLWVSGRTVGRNCVLCVCCVCNHIRRLRFVFASGSSTYFMYYRFLTFKNSVCYPQSVYVFCVVARINTCHFPMQHLLIGFYNRDVCLLRGTFCIPHSAHTVYLCVLCGPENKQRLYPYTSVTDWIL